MRRSNTCSVCLLKKDVRRIPCCHFVCFPCLKKLTGEEEEIELKCPICRKEHSDFIEKYPYANPQYLLNPDHNYLKKNDDKDIFEEEVVQFHLELFCTQNEEIYQDFNVFLFDPNSMVTLTNAFLSLSIPKISNFFNSTAEEHCKERFQVYSSISSFTNNKFHHWKDADIILFPYKELMTEEDDCWSFYLIFMETDKRQGCILHLGDNKLWRSALIRLYLNYELARLEHNLPYPSTTTTQQQEEEHALKTMHVEHAVNPVNFPLIQLNEYKKSNLHFMRIIEDILGILPSVKKKCPTVEFVRMMKEKLGEIKTDFEVQKYRKTLKRMAKENFVGDSYKRNKQVDGQEEEDSEEEENDEEQHVNDEEEEEEEDEENEDLDLNDEDLSSDDDDEEE